MRTETEISPHRIPLGADRVCVLMVEDEPHLRASLRAGLADEFRVIGLDDGQDFLAAVCLYQSCVVPKDLNLRYTSGLVLCDKLRRKGGLNGVRVLVMTALLDNASFLDSYTKGADGLLHKPLPEFRVRMRELLR